MVLAGVLIFPLQEKTLQGAFFQEFVGMGLASAWRRVDKAERVRGNNFSGGEITKTNPPMGDRSPKSNQKQASQKQAKADVVAKNKQAAVTAQQATKAKAAAAKKK